MLHNLKDNDRSLFRKLNYLYAFFLFLIWIPYLMLTISLMIGPVISENSVVGSVIGIVFLAIGLIVKIFYSFPMSLASLPAGDLPSTAFSGGLFYSFVLTAIWLVIRKVKR